MSSGWVGSILPDDGIKYSTRRKRSDAYIVSQEAMEEIVMALRDPDPRRSEALAKELVRELGKRRGSS